MLVLFYSGVPSDDVKRAHSKPLVQTVINLQNSAPSFSRQKRSLASLDAPYVQLLLQCCLHLQTVSHSNGCSSLRIRPQILECSQESRENIVPLPTCIAREHS
jgi:hypothetical protein